MNACEHGRVAPPGHAGPRHFVERAKGPAWDRSREGEQVRWDDHTAYMRVVAQEELVVPGGRSARPFGAALQRVPTIVPGEDSGVRLDQGWSLRS
jgi:hypothetical protein